MSRKTNLKLRALRQMGATKDTVSSAINRLFSNRHGYKTQDKIARLQYRFLNGRKRT